MRGTSDRSLSWPFVGRDDDGDSWRQALLSSYEGAWPSATCDEVRSAPCYAPLSVQSPELVVPRQMLPAGPAQELSFRRLRWADALPRDALLSSARSKTQIAAVQRICIAAAVVPRTARRRKGYLPKVSTWLAFCHRFFRLSRWIFENKSHPIAAFEHLTALDLAEAVDGTSRLLGGIVREVSLLKSVGARFEWPDVFDDLRSDSGAARAFDRSGARRITVEQPAWEDTGASEEVMCTERVDNDLSSNSKTVERYIPLPDRFVSEAGWKVLWFIESLGPGIVDILGRVEALEPGMSDKVRNREVARILANHQWKDIRGVPVEHIPINLVLHIRGPKGQKRVERVEDICGLAEIQAAAYLLQLCHAFVVSMGTGMRASELLSLNEDCVRNNEETERSAKIIGRTFKLSSFCEGEERHWPLNAVCEEAIKQQVRFIQCFASRSSRSLWVQMVGSTTGDEVTRRGDELSSFKWNSLLKSLCLEGFIDGRGLHHHRFRKTVARLCALSIVGSPKVLMDLFGHKSISMTLSYILSNQEIAAEISKIAEEMVILNAENMLTGANASPRQSVPSVVGGIWGAPLRGETELGGLSIGEAARLMTVNGLLWNIVRPGVVCTKGPGQAGPCTRAAGHPDPARCQPDCCFRCEDPRNRHDAEESIEFVIGKLGSHSEWDADPGAVYWLGQLRHHLRRFPELSVRWEGHPTVVRLRHWEKAHRVAEPQLDGAART